MRTALLMQSFNITRRFFQARRRYRLAWLVVGLGLIGTGSYRLSPWLLPQAGYAAPVSVSLAPNSQPTHIRLPSIGVEGDIEVVTVDEKNRIGAPHDIGKAGWFVKSAIPGTRGLSIIDGHVNGEYKHGVFSRLKDLRTDDIFVIEYNNGSELAFRVVSSRLVTEEAANTELYTTVAGIPNQLNLITCSGAFQESTQTYDKRLIVVARQENE